MLNRYTPSYVGNNGRRRVPMFSLAVSIPCNSDGTACDTSGVTDDPVRVKNTILQCEVYAGTRVVAATVLRWRNVLDQCPNERVQWDDVLRQCGQTSMAWADVKRQCPRAVREGRADHAEYRTLQRFDTLTRNVNTNDLLLFYVLSSPCDKRCTDESNPWNILDHIKQILRWKHYAVVFSNVFKPRNGPVIPESDRRGALERLGRHEDSFGRSIGLNNIFRCTCEGAMQCTSCSSNGEVTPYCYSYDWQPGPQHGKRCSWDIASRLTWLLNTKI